jgi:thiosulfate dehydrogenase [quinone] large subunit
MQKPASAYLLFRLPIAVSMLTHGIERLPKLEAFSSGMVRQFAKSPLPQNLVHLFGSTLPFLELLTGVLLLLGLFTRFATIAGVAIMLALIFGSGLIEQWNAVFTQLFYAAWFATLILYADFNRFSVDAMLERR